MDAPDSRKKRLSLPTPRTFAAMLAGLLWAQAFPLPNFAMLAWIAPGLLLMTGFGVRPRTAWRLGYLAGLIHFLVSLYWLLNIPFAIGNVAAWLALSAYCALYPATWLWVCHRLAKPSAAQDDEPLSRGLLGNSPYSLGAAPIKLRGETWDAIRATLNRPWPIRQLWLLVGAASWVGLEFLRGWFLGGFPWNFLGASQFQLVPLIQIAGVTGVHGVSFLVTWVSLALALGAATVIARPQIRFAWKSEVAPALLTLLLVIVWGVGETTRPLPRSDREIEMALVQPSIPQTLIFDPEAATNRFEQMLSLTREAIATKPDVIVWPEASLPMVTREAFSRLLALINEARVPIILGTDDAEPGNAGRYNIYNSVMLFGADGQYRDRYRKQRLVIFGEYTPGVHWLPFLADWSPAGIGFSEGQSAARFIVEPVGANISPNICFEDNFTDLVRDQVAPETDIVLNLTNNGWFGESAAQWQHAANAVFRAVENAIPLVRCTNNGLTCWIDQQGRIRQVFRDSSGSVYGSGVVVFRVPLLPEGTKREITFYGRFGDWFPWMCFGIFVVCWLSVFSRKSRVTDAGEHDDSKAKSPIVKACA